MIPILIKIKTLITSLKTISLKTTINNVFKSIKKYAYILLIGLCLVLTGLLYINNRKLNQLDKDVGRYKNNMLAYENTVFSLDNEKRVLELNISDLRHSNDVLIQRLENVRDSLKLTKKELKQAYIIQSSLQDTLTHYLNLENTYNTPNFETVISDNCDFCTTITPNDLTTINICKSGDKLEVIPDIRNDLLVYIYLSKEYRNKRKNIFDRLFHWDWKRDNRLHYEIVNTNPLLVIKTARVININK